MSGAAAILLFACAPTTTVRSSPSAPASIEAVETSTPQPTSTGTLKPLPTTPVDAATPTPLAKAAQAEVTYSPPPPAKPTPTPDPELWRWEGVVVDDAGKPLQGVCVAVGPHGCQAQSPRTDARGTWHVDFPQAPVQYDLHFTKEGYKTFDVRVTPTSAWTLNVMLKP